MEEINESKNGQPAWLLRLQKNSWEPEVIISGLTLAFILAFPARIFDFAVYLIQDLGVNFLGSWLTLLYLSFVINVFKVFLITHLAMRFAWAGLLGLSYAFPQGVIEDKLFNIAKGINYQKPFNMLLKMERLCSITFGIPIYLAFIFLPITAYLLLLLFIYKSLNIEFFVVYLIFLGTVILLSILNILANKYKLKITKSAFASIGAIYSSNLGKWRFNFYLILIFLLTVPFIIQDNKNFWYYFQEIGLTEEEIEWPDKSIYFSDYKELNKRFPKILLSSDWVNDDKLKVYLAYYGEDEKYIKSLRNNYSTTLDTLGWNSLKELPDLYRFYINDSLISIPNWQKTVLPQSNQKAFETTLDLGNLKNGYINLQVDKLVVRLALLKTGEPKLRRNWANVSFYKN